MKKDAYYFPHYCNARHDRKIKRIIKELGVEGYGIYFMLLEVLREQTDYKYPLEDVDLLADEFNVSEIKVKTIIGKYHLFEIDKNEMFFSTKLIFYLQPYIEKTLRARKAANIRWNNVDANALPEHSKCNADQNARKGEERKGKEIKENKRNIKENYSKIFFNDFEELKKELLNSEVWIQELAKLYNIETDDVIKYLYNFLTEQKTDDNLLRSINDIKIHFRRSLKIIIEKKNNLNGRTNNIQSKQTFTEAAAEFINR